MKFCTLLLLSNMIFLYIGGEQLSMSGRKKILRSLDKILNMLEEETSVRGPAPQGGLVPLGEPLASQGRGCRHCGHCRPCKQCRHCPHCSHCHHSQALPGVPALTGGPAPLGGPAPAGGLSLGEPEQEGLVPLGEPLASQGRGCGHCGHCRPCKQCRHCPHCSHCRECQRCQKSQRRWEGQHKREGYRLEGQSK